MILNYYTNIVCLLSAVFYCLSIYAHNQLLSDNELVSICVVVLFFQIYFGCLSKIKAILNRKEYILCSILAVIFSQFLTIGYGLDVCHSFDYYFGSALFMLLWFVQSLCYFYLIRKVLMHMLYYFEMYKCTSTIEKHVSIRKYFFLIFLVKLLMVIFFYPCVFDFDAALSLRTYLDPKEIVCDHNPYIIQTIHGLAFNFGRIFGDPSVGFALLTIFFDFISSLILIYGIFVSSLFQLNRRCINVLVLVLALFPIYPYLSHYPCKDGLFAYAFLFYCLTIMHIVLKQGKVSWFAILGHTSSIMAMSLFRQQGLYIVMFETIVLFIVCFNFWRIIASMAVPSIVIVLLVKLWIIPLSGVQPTSKGEAYGMLFQQSAYYLKKYPQDITDVDKNAINEILPINRIVSSYNPIITDPVKGLYKYSDTKKNDNDKLFHYIVRDRNNETVELREYLKAWFHGLLRHPICYVEAVLNVCYPFFFNTDRMMCNMMIGWENTSATTPEFSFRQNEATMRIFSGLFSHVRDFPVIKWIVAIPYYIWLSLLLAGIIIIRKDRNGIAIITPVILSIGVLAICPVADMRYAYPILVMIPFLLLYVLTTNKRNYRMYE